MGPRGGCLGAASLFPSNWTPRKGVTNPNEKHILHETIWSEPSLLEMNPKLLFIFALSRTVPVRMLMAFFNTQSVA